MGKLRDFFGGAARKDEPVPMPSLRFDLNDFNTFRHLMAYYGFQMMEPERLSELKQAGERMLVDGDARPLHNRFPGFFDYVAAELERVKSELPDDLKKEMDGGHFIAFPLDNFEDMASTALSLDAARDHDTTMPRQILTIDGIKIDRNALYDLALKYSDNHDVPKHKKMKRFMDLFDDLQLGKTKEMRAEFPEFMQFLDDEMPKVVAGSPTTLGVARGFATRLQRHTDYAFVRDPFPNTPGDINFTMI